MAVVDLRAFGAELASADRAPAALRSIGSLILLNCDALSSAAVPQGIS